MSRRDFCSVIGILGWVERFLVWGSWKDWNSRQIGREVDWKQVDCRSFIWEWIRRGQECSDVVMHLGYRRFRKDPLLFAIHIVVCACITLKFVNCGLVQQQCGFCMYSKDLQPRNESVNFYLSFSSSLPLFLACSEGILNLVTFPESAKSTN